MKLCTCSDFCGFLEILQAYVWFSSHPSRRLRFGHCGLLFSSPSLFRNTLQHVCSSQSNSFSKTLPDSISISSFAHCRLTRYIFDVVSRVPPPSLPLQTLQHLPSNSNSPIRHSS